MISVTKDKKRFDRNREVVENSLLLNTLFFDMAVNMKCHCTYHFRGKIIILNMYLSLCVSVYNEGHYVHLREFAFLYFKKDHFSWLNRITT